MFQEGRSNFLDRFLSQKPVEALEQVVFKGYNISLCAVRERSQQSTKQLARRSNQGKKTHKLENDHLGLLSSLSVCEWVKNNNNNTSCKKHFCDNQGLCRECLKCRLTSEERKTQTPRAITLSRPQPVFLSLQQENNINYCFRKVCCHQFPSKQQTGNCSGPDCDLVYF